jgi:endoglucanase
MDVAAFLEEICALPGFSGMEGTVAARIAEEFKKYSDDVHIDKMGNVRAIMGQGEPRVMVAAHMDEVGLLVSTVEDNGFIRLYDTYMLDPRILPGSEVTVWGKEPLYGVIGVKPPHLTNGPHKAAAVDELAVDVGLPAEEVRQLVKTGDMVTFKVPMTKLMNNRVAYKTFDDRACVACMILAMKELSEQKLHCTVEFVATRTTFVTCMWLCVFFADHCLFLFNHCYFCLFHVM